MNVFKRLNIINIMFLTSIKGGMQAKNIWKQDPEASIWAQKGREWGVEKAPQWRTFVPFT